LWRPWAIAQFAPPPLNPTLNYTYWWLRWLSVRHTAMCAVQRGHLVQPLPNDFGLFTLSFLLCQCDYLQFVLFGSRDMRCQTLQIISFVAALYLHTDYALLVRFNTYKFHIKPEKLVLNMIMSNLGITSRHSHFVKTFSARLSQLLYVQNLHIIGIWREKLWLKCNKLGACHLHSYLKNLTTFLFGPTLSVVSVQANPSSWQYNI